MGPLFPLIILHDARPGWRNYAGKSRDQLLIETVREIREAGFNRRHPIILEDGPESDRRQFEIHNCRWLETPCHLGPWGAWWDALQIGAQIQPDSPLWMICEDDIAVSGGTADWLAKSLPSNLQNILAISLWRPQARPANAVDGWSEESELWGSLALLVPSTAFWALHESASLRLRTNRKQPIDEALNAIAERTGMKFLISNRSLVDHDGNITREEQLSPLRRGWGFVPKLQQSRREFDEPIVEPKIEPPQGKLAVIGCYFNPLQRRSIAQNYRRWFHEMSWWHPHVFTAHVAFGEALSTATLRFAGNERHTLFLKEALLNRLVEGLPDEFDHVAWIDTDMLFFNRNWIRDAQQALQKFAAIQLWDRWWYVDQQGQMLESETRDSIGPFGRNFTTRPRCAPGGAWMGRRGIFPLYEANVVGGGDVMAIEAWMGSTGTYFQNLMNREWLQHYRQWAGTATEKVCGCISSIRGDAIHLFHGTRADRRYAERTRFLSDHHFDPAIHLTCDDQGLLCWSDAAPPEMMQAVADYFESRNEDGNGGSSC